MAINMLSTALVGILGAVLENLGELVVVELVLVVDGRPAEHILHLNIVADR